MPIPTPRRLFLRTKITGAIQGSDLENRELLLGQTEGSLFAKDNSANVLQFAPLNDSDLGSNVTWSGHYISEYVQNKINGLNWQNSVISIFDPTSGLPTLNIGDRYISFATINGWIKDYIYECLDGISWEAIAPVRGDALWIEQYLMTYVYNGSEWVKHSSIFDHNTLYNLQGGATNEFYHLSLTHYNTLLNGVDASLLHHHNSSYYTISQIDSFFEGTAAKKKIDWANVLNVPLGSTLVKGIAKFDSEFFNTDGFGNVSLLSNIVNTINTDQGIISPESNTLVINGDSSQGVVVNGISPDNTITVTMRNASTTQKGVSSYNTNHFSISNGVVSLFSPGIWDVYTNNGTFDMSSKLLYIHGDTSSGIYTDSSSNVVTIRIHNADTSSQKGVATFDSSYFTSSNGFISFKITDFIEGDTTSVDNAIPRFNGTTGRLIQYGYSSSLYAPTISDIGEIVVNNNQYINGNLFVGNSNSNYSISIDGTDSAYKMLSFLKQGSLRIQSGLSNTPDSTGDYGNDYCIATYDNSGVFVDLAFILFRRSGGSAQFNRPLKINGTSPLEVGGASTLHGGVNIDSGNTYKVNNIQIGLNDLSDVSSSSPSSAQMLIYDGTSKYKNVSISGDISINSSGSVTVASKSSSWLSDSTNIARLNVDQTFSGSISVSSAKNIILIDTSSKFVFANDPTNYYIGNLTVADGIEANSYYGWYFKHRGNALLRVGYSASATVTAYGTLGVYSSGGITTDQATFPLLNTTATTVNAFGAATSVNISSSAANTVFSVGNGSSSGGNTIAVNGAAATHRAFAWRTNGSTRWFWDVNNTAEFGSNAGSDMVLSAYDDSGAWLSNVLAITRSTGKTYLYKDVAFSGVITTDQTSLTLFNTVATTVNTLGAATSIGMGATTGTVTLNNPTIVGSQTTVNLWNTTSTTVNAFGAATTLNMGNSAGSTTLSGKLGVNKSPTYILDVAGSSYINNGVELVTNGTFDTTTTGWTGWGITPTIVAGQIKIQGTNVGSPIYVWQIITGLTIGKRYKVTLTNAATNAAATYVFIGSASSGPAGTGYNAYYSTSSASGTITTFFTATTTTCNITFGHNDTNATYHTEWDNASLTEMGDVTITGSLTATPSAPNTSPIMITCSSSNTGMYGIELGGVGNTAKARLGLRTGANALYISYNATVNNSATWAQDDTGKAPAWMAIVSGNADGNIVFYTSSTNNIGAGTLALTIDKNQDLQITGNCNVGSGKVYKINGTQITSTALSDSTNLVYLNAANAFTGQNTITPATDLDPLKLISTSTTSTRGLYIGNSNSATKFHIMEYTDNATYMFKNAYFSSSWQVDTTTMPCTGIVFREASADAHLEFYTSATNNMSPGTLALTIDKNQGAQLVGTFSAPTINATTFASVGTSTNYGRLGQNLNISAAATYGGIAVATWTTSAAQSPLLDFNRSKSATPGNYAAVALNDALGYISFQGSDSTKFYASSYIVAEVDGTVAVNQVPGRMKFYTTTSAGAAALSLTLDKNQASSFGGMLVNSPMTAYPYVYHLRSVAGWSAGASQTGTIKITLPVFGNYTFFSIKIMGYDYNAIGGWEAGISGYNYVDHNLYNSSSYITGNAPFTSIRFGNDTTRDVILLGTTSSLWHYAKIEVTDVMMGGDGGTTAGWGTALWGMALIASETGLSVTATLSPTWYSKGALTASGVITAGSSAIALTNTTGNLTNASVSGTAATTKLVTSDGTNLSWQTPKVKSIILTAAGGYPVASYAAGTPTSAETTTNKVNYYYSDYTDTTCYLNWNIILPSDYNASTVTAKVYWMPTTGSGDVIWKVAGICYGDNTAIDAAYGTASDSTDTIITTNSIHISPAATVTLGGTPAAEKLCNISLGRNPADSCTATVRFLALKLDYTPLVY